MIFKLSKKTMYIDFLLSITQEEGITKEKIVNEKELNFNNPVMLVLSNKLSLTLQAGPH